MTTPTPCCVMQRRPEESGAAALASVARHHGLPITLAEMQALLDVPSLAADLGTLLVQARTLGLEAVPLEGEYHQLPEVPRPNLVIFSDTRGDGRQRQRFAVLYEIDDGGASIADPRSGRIERLDRETFVRQWTGDCVQLEPDPVGLERTRQRLLRLRNPWLKLRRALGLTPPDPRKRVFLAAVAGVGASGLAASSGVLPGAQRLAGDLAAQVTVAAVALAWLSAVWSWWFADVCRACDQAARSVGELPLAPAGVLAYGTLLPAVALAPDSAAAAVALCAAAGAHALLVGVLIRARLACPACLLAAAGVFVAGGLAIARSPVGQKLLLAAAVSAGFVASWLAIATARKLSALQWQVNAQRLALQTAASSKPSPGQVRLVVYKRDRCPMCKLYEAVLRPAVEQDFGARVVIEERNADRESVAVPLAIVQGSLNIALTQPDYEQLSAALRAAVEPAPVSADLLPGVYVTDRAGSVAVAVPNSVRRWPHWGTFFTWRRAVEA